MGTDNNGNDMSWAPQVLPGTIKGTETSHQN